MPAIAQGTFYIDADSLQRVRQPGPIAGTSFISTGAGFYPLKLREARSIQLYWVRKLNGAWKPVPHPDLLPTIEIFPDPPPVETGTLVATYEAESTEELNLAASTLHDLSEALNALATVEAAGGVTVNPLHPPYEQLAPLPATVNIRRILDRFLVSWNIVGPKSNLDLKVTSLRPETLETAKVVVREGDAEHTERVALITKPKRLAYAQLDSALPTPAITASSITAGIGNVHAVHQISISPMPFPGDEFAVTVAGGTETRWLPIDASGEDLSQALNAANGETGYNAWRMDKATWQFRYPVQGNKALPDVTGIFAESSGSEQDLKWEDDLELYDTFQGGFDANLTLSVSDGSSVIRRETDRIRILP